MKDFENVIEKEYIKYNEPMSKHTSMKVGGNADIYIEVTDSKKMQEIISLAKEKNIPITIIGNGSNLLVSDEGIRGLVVKYIANGINIFTDKDELEVKLQETNSEINKKENKESSDKNQLINANKVNVIVEAGAINAVVANSALEHGLSGLEFLAGIPGCIAGAVYMNAGAYGKEIKDVLSYVKYIDIETNEIKTIEIENDTDNDITNKLNEKQNENQQTLKCKKDDIFSYRNSIFQKMNTVIIEVGLTLVPEDKAKILEQMNEYKEKRMNTQPLDKPSAGSTFKRGEDYVAAKLIDEAGLKGYKIGGAEVSTKHAGFIINSGNATCKDILELIEYIQKKVENKFNKKLELEVRIIK